MAYLIPENVRRDKSIPAAHRRVGSALASGLDDAVTVWYEPALDPGAERSHFVVLDPAIGVVVLQVFEPSADEGEVLGVWQGEIRVSDGAGERDAPNPLERADAVAGELRRALGADPLVADVPVASLAVFPKLSADAAEQIELGLAMDTSRVLFKGDIDQALQDEAVLPRRFQRAMGSLLDEDLDRAAVDIIRGVIHPEVVITPPPADVPSDGSLFSAASLGEDDVMKVMDRQQERMARGLGSGHRVIRGVAGSGKTLVLVHRARTLAKLLPSKRILVTCFTKSLASQLREQLAAYPNVEVVNLDRLMHRAIADAGMKNPADQGRWGEVPAVALEALQRRAQPKYRAVMVDEAQDFDTSALRFCVELLEATDPAEQDLVIVADSAQNIFRKQFRWKEAGIQAQGRTRILRVNYRNTQEILRFAHAFLTADGAVPIDAESDPEDELSIIPAEASERSGPEPTVEIVASVDDEVAAVVARVRSWVSPGARSRSTAVLLGSDRSGDRGRLIAEGLDRAGVAFYWATDPDDPKKRDGVGSAHEPVVLSTIASAKGLEFDRVVVAGLKGGDPDPLANRKLLYVGFTRAIDQLAVITDRSNAFVGDLEAVRSA